MTNLRDLIDMSISGETVAPVKSRRVQSASVPLLGHQFRAKALEPTKADRLLYHWILDHADAYDFKFADVRAGNTPQHSNEYVELHLNTRGQKRRPLTKLALWQVTAFRRGMTPDLYLRPKRGTGAATVTVRFDADAHEGQTDAQATIDAINADFFHGRLHDATSRGGHGAWATFELAAIEGKQGTWYEKKTVTNSRLSELEAALRRWCEAKGFAAKIEINGKYRITAQERDETIRIVNRGTTFKAPRCPDDADVQRLIDSRFPVAVFHDILSAAGAPPKPAKAKRKTVRNRLRTMARIMDRGDKTANRAACVGKASRDVLPRDQWNADVHDLTDEQRAAIRERANHLYETNKLNGGDRDSVRDRTFDRILPYVLETNGSSIHPGTRLFFDVADVERADQLLRSKVSNRQLKKLNSDPKLKGFKINRAMMSWALPTFAKNIVTSAGDVPAVSIRGMLEWLGFRVNGTVVDIITELFERLSLVICTDSSYRRGQCRRYKVTETTWTLPFIAHLALRRDEVKASRDAAARDRGGQMNTSTPIYFSLPYSMWGAGESMLTNLQVPSMEETLVCPFNMTPDAQFWPATAESPG